MNSARIVPKFCVADMKKLDQMLRRPQSSHRMVSKTNLVVDSGKEGMREKRKSDFKKEIKIEEFK